VVFAYAEASSLCLLVNFSKCLRYDNVVIIIVILEDDNVVKVFIRRVSTNFRHTPEHSLVPGTRQDLRR
jgi:hypothetical protein